MIFQVLVGLLLVDINKLFVKISNEFDKLPISSKYSKSGLPIIFQTDTLPLLAACQNLQKLFMN